MGLNHSFLKSVTHIIIPISILQTLFQSYYNYHMVVFVLKWSKMCTVVLEFMESLVFCQWNMMLPTKIVPSEMCKCH